jgi:hypothetical protein
MKNESVERGLDWLHLLPHSPIIVQRDVCVAHTFAAKEGTAPSDVHCCHTFWRAFFENEWCTDSLFCTFPKKHTRTEWPPQRHIRNWPTVLDLL